MEKVSSGYYIYGDCKHQNIMTFRLEMVEDIDKIFLQQAINRALCIHPNFRVKLIWKENNFWFVPNANIFQLNDEKEFVLVRETNEYLFGVFVEGKIISLHLSHILADGSTLLPFIKTFLLIYYNLLGCEDFSKIIEFREKQYQDFEKYMNPYQDVLMNKNVSDKLVEEIEHFSFSKNENNRSVKVKQFKIDSERMRQIGENADRMACFLAILADSCLMDSSIDSPVTAYVIMDMRRALKIKKATHECLSQIQLNLGKNREVTLMDRTREYQELWDNSDHENQGLINFRQNANVIKTFQRTRMSYQSKANLYNHLLELQVKNQDTFSFSMMTFSNKQDILNKYVQGISVYGINHVMNMLIEIQQVGDVECLTMTYCNEASGFVSTFENKLKELGMYMSSEEIEIEKIEMDIDWILDNCETEA